MGTHNFKSDRNCSFKRLFRTALTIDIMTAKMDRSLMPKSLVMGEKILCESEKIKDKKTRQPVPFITQGLYRITVLEER